MASFSDLNSDKALVCHREINCEQGGATVHMVLLPDGFLIDCGTNAKRAEVLAVIINEGGAERLSKTALRV